MQHQTSAYGLVTLARRPAFQLLACYGRNSTYSSSCPMDPDTRYALFLTVTTDCQAVAKTFPATPFLSECLLLERPSQSETVQWETSSRSTTGKTSCRPSCQISLDYLEKVESILIPSHQNK